MENLCLEMSQGYVLISNTVYSTAVLVGSCYMGNKCPWEKLNAGKSFCSDDLHPAFISKTTENLNDSPSLFLCCFQQ